MRHMRISTPSAKSVTKAKPRMSTRPVVSSCVSSVHQEHTGSPLERVAIVWNVVAAPTSRRLNVPTVHQERLESVAFVLSAALVHTCRLPTSKVSATGARKGKLQISTELTVNGAHREGLESFVMFVRLAHFQNTAKSAILVQSITTLTAIDPSACYAQMVLNLPQGGLHCVRCWWESCELTSLSANDAKMALYHTRVTIVRAARQAPCPTQTGAIADHVKRTVSATS
jgi:hypothetical protein